MPIALPLAATVLAQAASGIGPPPVITAKSAIVIERESGQVLFERAADVPRPPASTTKIMTALLLIERLRPEDRIVAPAGVEQVTGASLHLKPGEVVTARDAASALMLRSANDMCYAVAHRIAGSVEGFARLMNERARQMGCENTTFVNPHGLTDKGHITTARDLARITQVAMKDPLFREIAKTRRKLIERSINTQDRLVISKNRLLKTDPRVIGVKTGFTVPAGRCFVGAASHNGFEIITVVLNSQDWQADTRALIDWTYRNFQRIGRIEAGKPLNDVIVKGGDGPLTMGFAEPVTILGPVGTAPGQFTTRLFGMPATSAPVKKGQPLAKLFIKDGFGRERSYPLLALQSVGLATAPPAPPSLSRATWALGGAMVLAALLLLRRGRAAL